MSLGPLLQPSFPSSLWQARQHAAFDRLAKSGWPDRRSEDWKHTSLSAFKSLSASAQAPGAWKITSDLQGLQVQSSEGWLEDSAAAEWLSRFEKMGGRGPRFVPDFVECKTRNFMFVKVPAGKSCPEPVVVESAGGGTAEANQLWIEVAEGASAHFLVKGRGGPLQLNLLRVWVQAGASASLTFLGDLEDAENLLSTTIARVEGAGSLRLYHCALGGKTHRQELDLQVVGSGAHASVASLSVGGGASVLDHTTWIEHEKGGSSTSQLAKAVVGGNARSVFNGMIRIAHGADLANSDQLAKALILSRGAEVDSRPQLEVLADDVKASHGSATGKLNPEEIFYLQSRGLAPAQAQRMLVMASVIDVIESHPQAEIAAVVREVVERHLHKVTGEAHVLAP